MYHSDKQIDAEDEGEKEKQMGGISKNFSSWCKLLQSKRHAIVNSGKVLRHAVHLSRCPSPNKIANVPI